MKKIVSLIVAIVMLVSLVGCQFGGDIEELKGNIKGNTYQCKFYANDGENFMNVSGENINMTANIVEEKQWQSEGGWGTVETMSSVITMNIDGKQMTNCGTTVLFEESGLTQDIDFKQQGIEIVSESKGISDITLISGIVNKCKNFFGGKKVVIIQSQLGDPICAYSGNEVSWKVCENLPKTTRLTIDGRLLYIHRANFQVIDKSLLNTENQ